MSTTIVFVILSICTTLNGSTALVKYIGRKPTVETMIIQPPKEWLPGDTIEITTSQYMDGKQTVIKQDTTIIRWVK